MCAYARVVLARGGDLLGEAAFDRWIGPYTDTDEQGTRYGYGWNVLDEDGARVIRHTGGTVGFTALLAIRPDDGLAVAVCMNGHGVREALGSFALAAGRAAIRGDPLPEPVPDPPYRIPNAVELAGTYVDDDLATVALETAGGGLVLRTGPIAVRLERWPDARDAFAVPHPALDAHLLRVERGVDGRPSALTHGPSRYHREGAIAWAEVVHDPAWDAFAGLYRADAPWGAAVRVYLRAGRLWCTWPSGGEELELRPLDDGWFSLGDPELPRRCRFADVVDGLAQTIEYNGAILSRSFDG